MADVVADADVDAAATTIALPMIMVDADVDVDVDVGADVMTLYPRFPQPRAKPEKFHAHQPPGSPGGLSHAGIRIRAPRLRTA